MEHLCNCVCVCVCVQASLGVEGDVSYTCETAGHFFLYQVLSRWERYVAKVKPLAETVSEGVTGHNTCFIIARAIYFHHVHMHIIAMSAL